jgi:DEAD/DEAH box helicase domain-containing protein
VDGLRILDELRTRRFYRDQVVEVRAIPEREPVFADVDGGLDSRVARALRSRGINRLYSHQAETIGHVRGGRSTAIVTGTASGKTLCYFIPTIETLLSDPASTALFIYPTKALAQDQLGALSGLIDEIDDAEIIAGTYDGDTSASRRRRLRERAGVILTNPDMLHQGILPQHARWARFFGNLRFVVIDEIHAYRGVFGSHLANVMRRLRRICRHHGSDPVFVCSSATIANPREHAESICGCEMESVENDGSPGGRRHFVFWNPPLRSPVEGNRPSFGGERRSALYEAVELMTALVRSDIQTIAFVRTRLSAELLSRDVRNRLRSDGNLVDAVRAYRGGYLPDERREIERKLANREILGVASTNALELGVDVGSLDACIMVGYPGTISSVWQQAGRAGRGRGESLVILTAQNTPMDQYLMAHTDYLFARSPEQAVIDADNPHIIVGHLQCAASELPLTHDDIESFGPYAQAVTTLLEEESSVRRIREQVYWSSSDYPAASVSLRNIAGEVYTILDDAPPQRVVGTLDEVSAFSQVHDHAVYLHGGETWLVTKLDLDQKIAHVQRAELDYYTRSVRSSEIGIDRADMERVVFGGRLGYGDVTVTTEIPMFRRIRFHSREQLGGGELNLPSQTLETASLWFELPGDVAESVRGQGFVPVEALAGVANVLLEVAPFFVMCDAEDIGVLVDSRNLSRDGVFIHDRYPGGMGFARRCYDNFEDLMRTAGEIIRSCSCDDGCPSCVGSATSAPVISGGNPEIDVAAPGKRSALTLLDALTGEASR